MKNKFIEQVTAQIKNKKARAQIEQELESHILDKIDYYVEIGYPYEEAERRATEEMGSPEDTALPLNALHKKGKRIFERAIWICICIIYFFASPLSSDFNYQSDWYVISHSIGVDFLSLAFAAIFVFILIIAQKRHSKLLAGFVGGEILLICLVSLIKGGVGSVFSLFAPMFYAFVTIITQGLSGYIDCIFGYGYIPDSLKPVLSALSATLIFILFAWSLLLFVSIYRKERMKTTKKMTRPINLIKSVISILLAVNFAVMAFATALAVTGLPQKIEDTRLERSEMIETVINWDTSKSEEELLSYLYGLGYKNYHSENNTTYINQKELYRNNSNNAFMITKFDEASDDYQFAYITTTQNSTQPLIVRNDLKIGFKETSWMEPGKIDLQKFLGFEWVDKAILVTHYRNDSQDIIQFHFYDEASGETVAYGFECITDDASDEENRLWEDYTLVSARSTFEGSWGSTGMLLPHSTSGYGNNRR